MHKKPKFKLQITQVALNAEQAVLNCCTVGVGSDTPWATQSCATFGNPDAGVCFAMNKDCSDPPAAADAISS